jgi:hypothetical protein
MWIVRLALQRPYTFIVMALVIILLTPVVLLRTPTDIFPDINIPVISLVWTFTGLEPQEMEQRITGNVERGIATLVNDVEHTESQSLNGIAVIKVYFQPGANIQTALAQTRHLSNLLALPASGSHRLRHHLFRIYGARNSAGINQRYLSEQQLSTLATISYARTSPPSGRGDSLPTAENSAWFRYDPVALQAKGLSAVDIVNAVTL